MKEKSEKFNLEGDAPTPAPKDKKQFKYRKKAPGGRSRETLNVTINPEYADKIERMVYWDRLESKSAFIDQVLGEALKGRDWPPIPGSPEDV